MSDTSLILPDPWLPQPGESPEAYKSFCEYRDQAHRSIALVRGKDKLVWAREFRWVPRVEAFDIHIGEFGIRVRKEKIAELMVNAAIRDAVILEQAQNLILREIQAYINKAMSAEFDPETPSIPLKELVKLLDYQAKYTRLLTGQATERVEVENYDNMDLDKLRQLQQLLRKE
jgi:hypothetical protein